jgi:hypothetical protein
MVIHSSGWARQVRRAAFLTTELVIAMGILLVAVIPMGYAFFQERQMTRALYNRAVAMEIVDGEIEVLRAGDWRSLPQGSKPYEVRAESATNLPPGRFVITREGRRLRLEWLPADRNRGGRILRELEEP